MIEPKFTGLWIPRTIFEMDSLSLQAKIVFGILDALDDEKGCYASNGYLSRHLGIKERQIRNILKELDDAKLIVRHEIDGKRIINTVIHNSTREAKNCLPPRQKIATPLGNKLPTDNIVNNIYYKDTISNAPIVGFDMPFKSKEFIDIWFKWVDYRKEIKKPIKKTTIDMAFKQFIVWGEQKSIDSIKISITNGWTGLFEPKNQSTKQPLTAKDHDGF